ncbi:MAG: hypothetical protein VYA84_17770 [Planctomycetota bacterium]|nr:hypothetical protein [Planctomycetota bacterium]
MLLPFIAGEIPIRATSKQFSTALRQRVNRGFLNNLPGVRQNYELVDCGSLSANVRAGNWLTAINVGMNDLFLDLSDSGKIQYRLSYWRWTTYCVGLGMILGLVMVAIFLTIDIRQYIANNPSARLPGLTIDQNVYFAWGNVSFWGFVWPWILVVLHKRSLRKLLMKTIAEVDEIANAKNTG